MEQFITIQYKMGVINADQVHAFVPKWITEEQANNIINFKED